VTEILVSYAFLVPLREISSKGLLLGFETPTIEISAFLVRWVRADVW